MILSKLIQKSAGRRQKKKSRRPADICVALAWKEQVIGTRLSHLLFLFIYI